ncbi:MAG: helix-turn-helix domain-containing protein [Chitinivibrionales bacterium]|nr:helix-turn-helix domain-containing protein [Chitinivibrionales bacterium]
MRTTGIERLYALHTVPVDAGPASCVVWQAKDVSRGVDFRTHMPSPVFVAVWFTVEGNAEVSVGGKQFGLVPGDCLLCPARVARTLRVTSPTPLRQRILLCHARLTSRLIDDIFGPLPVYVPAAGGGGTTALVDRIFEECQSPDRDSMRICDCLLEVLWRGIRRNLDRTQPQLSPSRERFERCREVLETECERLESLKQLADRCGMQPGSLCRLFKRHGAPSPYQSLQRARMAHAAELLLTTSLTVKQIGARVGYCDPYEFSRAFKRVMGISPRPYRRERG